MKHFFKLSQISKQFSNIMIEKNSTCKCTCAVQTCVVRGPTVQDPLYFHMNLGIGLSILQKAICDFECDCI